MRVLLINGPNINMLGIREPEIYGHKTYEDLDHYARSEARNLGIMLDTYQSNYEGDLVTKIQDALGTYKALIINPAAYTHTSIAILDALKAVGLPTVEVHLSDVSNREDFRKISYVGLYAQKTFSGKGFETYREALVYLSDYLRPDSKS